jgi:ribonuclease E
MTDTNPSGGSQEAWSKLADQFSEIAETFRTHYHRIAEANQPADPASQGTVERAVTKVGKAIEDTARTIDQSVRDPKVREDTGQAGSALLRAVGATLSDLGAALQRETDAKTPADPPADSAPQQVEASAAPEPAVPTDPTPTDPTPADPTPAPADSADPPPAPRPADA